MLQLTVQTSLAITRVREAEDTLPPLPSPPPPGADSPVPVLLRAR